MLLYTLLHCEPEFLLSKTLNKSEINMVVMVAPYRESIGVKQSASKATCMIPIYFEARPYKRRVFYHSSEGIDVS